MADALSRAEAASPLVRRARVEREEVAAREVGASILFPSNPVIGGAVGPRREIDRQGLEILLHAEQTIGIAGQRGARREVVSRSLRSALLREQVARAETRARVRSAYVGAQLARARVDAARQREALVTRLLEAVQARVSGGASSDVDLEVARLERGSAARARVDAALAAADASARLRLLVGRGPGETLELEAALAVPVRPTGTLAALLARAESQRAELAAVLSTRDEIDTESGPPATRGHPEPDRVRRRGERSSRAAVRGRRASRAHSDLAAGSKERLPSRERRAGGRRRS